jgi:hypothetical protein
LRKAFEAGMYFIGEDKGSYEEFIQSLKQSKTPKWFVVEMEVTKSQVFRDGDNAPYATLKTTTNSQGKKELVGYYTD